MTLHIRLVSNYALIASNPALCHSMKNIIKPLMNELLCKQTELKRVVMDVFKELQGILTLVAT